MIHYTYIETVVFDNFVITFILLLLSFHIVKMSYSKLKIILASFLACITSVCYPFLELVSIYTIIYKLALGFIICFIASFNKSIREIFKIYFAFILLTCLFGGVYYALYYSFLIYVGLDTIPLGFFGIFIFIIARLIVKLFKKYLQPITSDFSYNCELTINNKKIPLRAFLDTGNMLVDKVLSKPVVVVQLSSIKEAFSKSDYINILKKDIEKTNLNHVHYLEYCTIEGKNKSLLSFKPDKFVIYEKGKKKEVDCVIGISTSALFSKQNYQALLGLNMLGGKTCNV